MPVGRTWSDCLLRSSLIWVSAVCLYLFCSQLVFQILEHLSYSNCCLSFAWFLCLCVYISCICVSSCLSICLCCLCMSICVFPVPNRTTFERKKVWWNSKLQLVNLTVNLGKIAKMIMKHNDITNIIYKCKIIYELTMYPTAEIL